MPLYGYTFLDKVEDFDLESYVPHLGWKSQTLNPLKIYSHSNSISFFLHDEATDSLYEFIATDPRLLRSKEEYEKVIRTYLLAYPK